MLKTVLICGAVFLIALLLTGVLRRYALDARLIDEVGARTSHSRPTPRGGGAAIVVAAAGGLAVGSCTIGISHSLIIALLGGGLMVALVGWADDHSHVRPITRLAVHICAATWLVWWIGPFPFCALASAPPGWASLDAPATVLAVVWMINLFNFMDGIDGIAAGEAVVVALGGVAVTAGGSFGQPSLLAPPMLLAAATLGFLPWNLPLARIFLGDVGSGFLGFMLAAFVVAMGHVNPSLGLAWGILPGLFIADATVTLLRRAIRGERIFEAHRSHAYQKLARSLQTHLPVTITYLAATAGWLVPIAQLASDGRLTPIVALGVAWLPVFGLALALGSGKPDRATSGDAGRS